MGRLLCRVWSLGDEKGWCSMLIEARVKIGVRMLLGTPIAMWITE